MTGDWRAELEECQLCAWRCGVDRVAGERGVCQLGLPEVASRTLHPAPPESYTIFMAGCNFKCLHCQNWSIAHYPAQDTPIDGFVEPEELAEEAVAALESAPGRLMEADRLFFSGGSPTCSLPYVEAVVAAAREIRPEVKVNYDTNGFMTPEALERILSWTTSITFDLRAVNDEVHRAMTGAPSGPALANAEVVAAHKEQLWEFRILLVPQINGGEIERLCGFLAELDTDLPVCFLAFRPNFVLERHPGATRRAMERAVRTAKGLGLHRAYWSGHAGLPGEASEALHTDYATESAQRAGAYAQMAGCFTHPRDCGACGSALACALKEHRPRWQT